MLFIATIKRGLKIALRNPASFLNPLLFFIIAITLFPIAISPDPSVLSEIAGGLIWVVVLLAVLLSLSIIFDNDYDNAVLEQIVISNYNINVIILAKIIVHWILTGLPIILLSPLFGILLFLDKDSIIILVITLLLTTPTLSFIGAIGASLVVGVKNSGMLLALIILPLYIPILIFASNAINNSKAGLNIAGNLYFLATILVASMLIAPFVGAFAVRNNLD